MKKIEKILLPKELDVDTIVSLAIVYHYGSSAFSGISKAELEFRASIPKDKDLDYFLSNKILPLFPLKENSMVLKQLADYEPLGLDNYPIVNQTIASLKYSKHIFFKRGAIFTWSYLTQVMKDNPKKLLELVLPLLKQCTEIQDKFREIFFEYCMEAIKDGRLMSFNVKQNDVDLKIVFIDYDDTSICEYLFYKKEVLADVVVMFRKNGNIFIKTKDEMNIDLLDVVAILRVETARKKKIPFDKLNKHILNRKGLMPGLDSWDFDNSGNLLESVKPPHLDKLAIKRALLIGLDTLKMAKGMCPSKEGCIGKKCDFYSYNMLRCRKRMAGISDNFEKSETNNSRIRVYRNSK